MKFRYIIVLTAFFCLKNFAQEVIVRSNVSAKEIPYAKISYIRNDSIMGSIYTDEKGSAVLNFKKNNFTEIEVSHLGYESIKIQIEKIDTLIHLKEKVYNLEEVQISKSKSFWIGNKANRKSIYIGSSFGLEMTTLLKAENIRGDHKAKTLIFKVRRRDEQMPAILRINFYKNKNNCPDEIINRDIFVTLDSHVRKRISIDLTKYDLIIPEDGIFVGIESLGLANKEGKLLLTTSWADNSIAYNRTNEVNFTYGRNRFAPNNDWSPFLFKEYGNTEPQMYIPAILLEVR